MQILTELIQLLIKQVILISHKNLSYDQTFYVVYITSIHKLRKGMNENEYVHNTREVHRQIHFFYWENIHSHSYPFYICQHEYTSYHMIIPIHIVITLYYYLIVFQIRILWLSFIIFSNIHFPTLMKKMLYCI